MTRSEKHQSWSKDLAAYREATKQTDLGSAMSKFHTILDRVNSVIESSEKEEIDWPKTRKLTNPKTGDIAICWGNKFHNWDGPALYPKGNKKQGEYYLYGIRYEVEEWKEMKKQWEGLPWYKTPAILMDAGTARN